ncbi:MAG TPA: TlpA disulfide reductase family protein [Flavisolibacter sp.]
MNKLFLLLLLPIVSIAQSPKQFELKGKLDLSKPVDWIYLRYVSGQDNVTDSVQPKDGEFKIKGLITEPVVANLAVKFKQQGEEKSVREYVQLFLEPTKMEFAAKDSLKNNTVKGSAGYPDFAALMKEQEVYNKQFDPLYDAYDSLQKAGDKEGMKKTEDAINALNDKMNEAVYASFVRKHPNSSVALFAVKQYAGWDIDAAKVEPLFNMLPASAKALPSAKALKDRIDIARKTGIGNYAMDFTQNDTLGKPVSLSSFKGKYVLVDFWASWCGPCRRENPNVVKVFNKYKDRNFTILSVSLDRPDAKDKWLAAIHKDNLTWTHVSDLKYWDNAVAKQYGIRAIPQNLLLDPQGKIIAKNLRGEDLDAKLTDVFDKTALKQ